MKKLAYTAAILLIIISIIVQMMALIDDRYTIGSIWFIGVFGGFLALIGASKVEKSYEIAKAILLFSIIFGIIGIGFYAIIPAIMIIYILFQIRPKNR